VLALPLGRSFPTPGWNAVEFDRCLRGAPFDLAESSPDVRINARTLRVLREHQSVPGADKLPNSSQPYTVLATSENAGLQTLTAWIADRSPQFLDEKH
jgi:hypothetical protein